MNEPILNVEALDKRYGKLHAVNNVSFDIHPGEIVGLLGHNGAGKSTLIKCLMGVIHSYSGTIAVVGKDIRQKHWAIRKNVGFLLEPAFCDYLSARENLKLLDAVSGDPDADRVDEVLEIVSLKKFANKKVSGFSFGMRQRLGLAQVLLTQPKLIVLDEPTVGLDPMGVEIIKEIIVKCSQQGVAVLFSSHQLSDVLDICHRTIVMNQGSVVFDGPAEKLNRKYYTVRLACPVGEHAKALEKLSPELTVEENSIRFTAPDAVQDVLSYLVQQKLPIVDLDIDTSMDKLKRLMQQ